MDTVVIPFAGWIDPKPGLSVDKAVQKKEDEVTDRINFAPRFSAP